MYSLTGFTTEQIRQFIASQRDQPFSYAEVGATRGQLPAGYAVDHNRFPLGAGAEIFERAKAAIRGWLMFQFDWLQLCWPETPVEVGATVAVMIRVLGIWSLNACRIVYLIDEQEPVKRFGFAYGTLPEHAERGEERFSVEWHPQDNTVWYDILAFSRPNQLPAKLAYAYARRLQKRFAAASGQAMVRAVNRAG